LSPFSAHKIHNSLMKKGFRVDQTHHEMFWLYIGGKKTSIRTRISHGAKDYGDSLLSCMAKQLHLIRSELDDLISCPLSADDYQALLRSRGILKD